MFHSQALCVFLSPSAFTQLLSTISTSSTSALNFSGSWFVFLQARFRSSAFKPVTPKNFSSMQNLYPSSKSENVDHGVSNGLHRAYAHVPKAVSTSSSSSSPSRQGGPTSSGNKVSKHDFKLKPWSMYWCPSPVITSTNKLASPFIWLITCKNILKT